MNSLSLTIHWLTKSHQVLSIYGASANTHFTRPSLANVGGFLHKTKHLLEPLVPCGRGSVDPVTCHGDINRHGGDSTAKAKTL